MTQICNASEHCETGIANPNQQYLGDPKLSNVLNSMPILPGIQSSSMYWIACRLCQHCCKSLVILDNPGISSALSPACMTWVSPEGMETDPVTRFTNVISIAIQIWWQFHFGLIPIPLEWSLHYFACSYSGLCNCFFFLAIWWSVIELQQYKLSVRFKWWVKSLVKWASEINAKRFIILLKALMLFDKSQLVCIWYVCVRDINLFVLYICNLFISML